MIADNSLKNEISFCEKDDLTCEYLCNEPYPTPIPTPGMVASPCTHLNNRSVNGFPTFKCIRNGNVMSGYDNIDKVKAFVNECK